MKICEIKRGALIKLEHFDEFCLILDSYQEQVFDRWSNKLVVDEVVTVFNCGQIKIETFPISHDLWVRIDD